MTPTFLNIIVLAGTEITNQGTAEGYSQVWLRGEGPRAHVHEGIRRADGSGWVAIGETLPEENTSLKSQVISNNSLF